jgi:hypothetical protein
MAFPDHLDERLIDERLTGGPLGDDRAGLDGVGGQGPSGARTARP